MKTKSKSNSKVKSQSKKNISVKKECDCGDYDEDGFYIADSFGIEVNSIEAKVS